MIVNVYKCIVLYHKYGRYWYIGMARVPHMRNTKCTGKTQPKLSAWQ